MSRRGFRFEFWMILHSKEPGVVLVFDDFNQRVIGTGAGTVQSMSCELFAICVVDFVSMSMSLGHFVGPVGFGGFAAFSEAGGIRSQPHGAALVRDILLLIEQANDRMLGVLVEFR